MMDVILQKKTCTARIKVKNSQKKGLGELLYTNLLKSTFAILLNATMALELQPTGFLIEQRILRQILNERTSI